MISSPTLEFISDVFLCPDNRRILAGEAAVKAEHNEFILSLDGVAVSHSKAESSRNGPRMCCAPSSQLNGKEGARINQIFDGVPEQFKATCCRVGRLRSSSEFRFLPGITRL
jgi:hypothetical protein